MHNTQIDSIFVAVGWLIVKWMRTHAMNKLEQQVRVVYAAEKLKENVWENVR